ncbi:MAG: hypothetical protein ACTSV0_04390 [Candidatus Freyarchaeota archaeon]
MSLKRKMVDMMMPKEFGAISGLFHVAIFSLQKAIVDLVGAGGFKEYIFPSFRRSLETLRSWVWRRSRVQPWTNSWNAS